ncbi:MAG: hypothetical protein KF824_11720 [Fimbriimonadaceae bacterium]|nr:MAG: hypothetical protein KF824_11720 [Fimbriimonadaceae bacterium]
MKILFVCGRNLRRSPTAERVFQNNPGLKVRSGGTSKSSPRKVTVRDIEWADIVCVMEERYAERLAQIYPEAMQSARVETLDIPDVYEFMEEELVELLKIQIKEILR